MNGRSWAEYDKAQRRILELWQAGNVVFTDHAERRMNEQRIVTADVAFCLKYGDIKWHEERQDCWRYGIHGRSVDDLHLKLVVDVSHLLVVVSAFTRDEL